MMDDLTETDDSPEVLIWHYKGRDVPIEIHNGLSPE